MTTPSITDGEIAELKRLEALATKGPWKAMPFYEAFPDSELNVRPGQWACVTPGKPELEQTEYDAKLKAAARNALPKLIEDRQRLVERVAELEAEEKRLLGEIEHNSWRNRPATPSQGPGTRPVEYAKPFRIVEE